MIYELKRSKRKTISIKVSLDEKITVYAPLKTDAYFIDTFVKNNSGWIDKALKKAEVRRTNAEKYAIAEKDIPAFKKSAKLYLPDRTHYWAEIMGLEPAYVHITSAEKRYGSCNSKKGICYSYKLMAYPDDVIDYVIIHELAHIKHMNHSQKFYSLIERYMPDYLEKQNILQHKE